MKITNRIFALIVALSGVASVPVLPANAGPVNGVFSIKTNNGNYADVYGDNFRPVGDNTRVPTHLWNAKLSSNNFELGPDEGSGNEIRVAGQGICITPDSPLGKRPNEGTPVVATRDCANSWNWKRVGNTWVIGRHMDLCLDIAWGKDAQWSKMQVVNCKAGNPAQQFSTGQAQAAQPQPQSVQPQQAQPQQPSQPQVVNNPAPRPNVTIVDTRKEPTIVSVSEYEDYNANYSAVLISARAGAIPNQFPKVGHTIFGARKVFNRRYYVTYSNGTKVERLNQRLEENTTISTPGYELNLNLNAVHIDAGGLDYEMFAKWRSAGNQPRLDGYSFRTLPISEEQYKKAVPTSKGGYNTTYRGLGCFFYNLTGITQVGCNCTSVSARLFEYVTGEKLGGWSPSDLAKSIDKSNWLGDWNTFRLPIKF